MQSKVYGKKVELADRDLVESRADIILGAAQKGTASLLVVGDPYWYVASPSAVTYCAANLISPCLAAQRLTLTSPCVPKSVVSKSKLSTMPAS